MSARLAIRRIYDDRGADDGLRVLVDRVWPRGLPKQSAPFDLWCKEIAPSVDLRKWFGHDPERWVEFQRRYAQELDRNDAVGDMLKHLAKGKVTLIYAARDTEHNHARALESYLGEKVRHAS